MKRIKLFEEFIQTKPLTRTPDPKIKEWKKKSELEEEEEKIEGTWKDSKGVIHIKNWNTY